MSNYAHQQKIIDEDPEQTGLFLGTGSGKTRLALKLARGKVLIICPKTQKQDGNWLREFDDIDTMGVTHLKVVSKEEFRRDHEKLDAFDTVIVDEAHTCLGATPNVRYENKRPVPKTSQLFEALKEYVERTKPQRLYLCTATIAKSPMTIWGAAIILGQEWDFFDFRDAFYFKLPRPGREIWLPRQDRESKERLAQAVRNLGYVGQLSDYFDVPDQTYKTIFVEMTADQKNAIKDAAIDFPDPLVLIGKKHQIENGLLTGDEFNDEQTFKNAKLEMLEELAFEFPKMIVFVKYTAQIAQIKKALFNKRKVLVLDGKTKDKGKLIYEANNSDSYVLIAQSQISAGWEMPLCPVMVFASMTNSFVDRVQGEGRILRANALKKNLYIDLVVKGGVDEAVYESIRNKKDFDAMIYAKDNGLL